MIRTSTRRRRGSFSSMNQPVRCRVCRKMTTSIVDGVIGTDLCGQCLHEAGLENEHADGGHSVEHGRGPVADCPDCKAAAQVAAAPVPELREYQAAVLEAAPEPAPLPTPEAAALQAFSAQCVLENKRANAARAELADLHARLMVIVQKARRRGHGTTADELIAAVAESMNGGAS